MILNKVPNETSNPGKIVKMKSHGKVVEFRDQSTNFTDCPSALDQKVHLSECLCKCKIMGEKSPYSTANWVHVG